MTNREFIKVSISVLTISDSRSFKDDKSGNLLEKKIIESGHKLFDRKIVRDEIIDIQKEVFGTHPDPLSLFPFRSGVGHYNAEGYRLIAETIVKRLKADGIIPSHDRD